MTRVVRQRILAVLFVFLVVSSSLALYYGLALNVSKSGARVLDPAEIYAKSSRSVITIQGLELGTGSGLGTGWVAVLGSGFVLRYSGSYYIATNNHVVDGLMNLTVTFWNGNAYRGNVIGFDAYSDLAMVSTQASADEYYPLELARSSTLRVGDPVVAIGNPFGYSGTITFGIVSQLGRTIRYESDSRSFPIADAIQFSAAVNPGNSGGPLLNAEAKVIGITSAGVVGAEGLGFAIPSDTILRELPSLVTTGTYNKHPYLGIQVADMNYELSRVAGTNVTYGVLIEQVVQNGPASRAGLKGGAKQVEVDGNKYRIGGDVIVSINGNRIVNYDSLATYLERYTLPGQVIQVGIIRSGTFTTLNIVLGTRQSST